MRRCVRHGREGVSRRSVGRYRVREKLAHLRHAMEGVLCSADGVDSCKSPCSDVPLATYVRGVAPAVPSHYMLNMCGEACSVARVDMARAVYSDITSGCAATVGVGDDRPEKRPENGTENRPAKHTRTQFASTRALARALGWPPSPLSQANYLFRPNSVHQQTRSLPQIPRCAIMSHHLI